MKEYKLYNVFFPIWVLFLFPPIIFAVFIVNFIIDSIVVKITLKKLGVEPAKFIYRRTIAKTWIFGFLADIGGVFILFAFMLISSEINWLDSILEAVIFNPFSHSIAFLIVCFAVFVAAGLIYFLNMYAFKNTELTEEQRKKVALNLAIFTAPYFFLLPLSLFI